ncbi:hypothetical protein B0H11DRAFT_1926301 [Mycena galericulata]|nr:hypothetical protein B0H11DRAFT_1926301 [Mycena galericulata]
MPVPFLPRHSIPIAQMRSVSGQKRRAKKMELPNSIRIQIRSESAYSTSTLTPAATPPQTEDPRRDGPMGRGSQIRPSIIDSALVAAMRPALKILGKCSDSDCPTLESPPDIDRWTDALNSRFFGKGPKIAGQEWEQLLGHCEVPASSSTGVNLAQELVAVTTTRYSQTRYGKAPTDEAVAKLGRNKPFVVSSCLDARFLGRLRPFFKLVWMTFFGDFPSEDIAKKRFQAEHCAAAELGGDVPRERLLEYKAGEGWERVCILLESEHDVTDSEESLAESQPTIISDTRAFGEQMNKITYGVFQG